MNRTALLTALLVPVILAGSPAAQHSSLSDPMPGVVLVKFTPDALPEIQPRIVPANLLRPDVRSMLQAVGFAEGRRIFEHFTPADTLAVHRTTGETVSLIDLSRWYILQVPDADDIGALAIQLAAMPGVEAASPSFRGGTHETTRNDLLSTSRSSSLLQSLPPSHVISSQQVYPNDPLFVWGSQWGLYNQWSPGRDIHAPQAWEINRGRSDVVVAVIDTGVDYNHADLDPGDRSRVIAGFDTADNNSDPADDLPANASGGHGTRVAGALGAITDNGLQAAGVMWNLRIMPVKVFHTSGPWWDPFDWTLGSFMDWNLAQGIDWARANGADIINMSLGGPAYPWYVDLVWTNPVTQASLNAYRQGILQIASAGNDDENEALFPSSYPWVIAAGASNQSDQRVTQAHTGNWGSNYGNHLDVVAPGLSHGTLNRNNQVASFSGTSCSAPLVSGVTGLILSESRDRGLNLTNDDIRQVLRRTADKVQGMGGQDFHVEYGHGRVNAAAALGMLQSPNTVTHLNRTSGTTTLTWDTHSHTFINGAYGEGDYLASGTYHGVRQYRVSGHVAFTTPYHTVPDVWFRERETTGWSGANPNLQSPFVNITNVSTTGFDWEAYVYWIGANSLGQQINKYYPAPPTQLSIKFTVVGRPGRQIIPSLPPLTVNLSGEACVHPFSWGQWTATASGGSDGSYTFEWWKDHPQELLKTTTTTSNSDGLIHNSDHSFELRVDVTRGQDFAQDIMLVEVSSMCPIQDAEDELVADANDAQSREHGADERPLGDTGDPAFGIPQSFSLDGAYPNPFSRSTSVSFTLPEASNVTLVVHDALGREVTRIEESYVPTGAHTLLIHADGWPNGTYVYRIEAVGVESGAQFVDTRRMTLVR